MKIPFHLIFCFFPFIVVGQSIFSENFEGQSFPEGSILYDLDRSNNLIQLDPSIDPSNWYVWTYPRESGYFAYSTGLNQELGYEPMENWFVLPKIFIPERTTLYFKTRKIGINNPNEEFIEVWVSTGSNQINDFSLLGSFLCSVGWTEEQIGLDMYEGEEVHVAFVGRSLQGGHIGLDEINIISGSNEIYDIEMLDIAIENNYLLPSTYDLSIDIKNNSTTSIQNLMINYSIDSRKTVETRMIDNLTIPVLGEETIFIEEFLDFNEIGAYQLEVWASLPNGFSDSDESNDTQQTYVTILQNSAEKNVLLENYTGTWCVYCPRSPIIIEDLQSIYENKLIVVSHHVNDPLSIPATNELLIAIPSLANGLPSGTIDRYQIDSNSFSIGVEPEVWNSYISERINHLSPADIQAQIDFDQISRKLSIDAKINFLTDDLGDLRINAYVTESDISGYPQANAYQSDPISFPELYQAGNPILDYQHKHVLRSMLGGPFGQSLGAIEYTAGDEIGQSFSLVVPSEWNENNLDIVLVLSKYLSTDNISKSFIVNATSYSLFQVVSTDDLSQNLDIKIYPNPSSDYIEFNSANSEFEQIKIMDLQGRIIRSIKLDQYLNSYIMSIESLVPGYYQIEVKTRNSCMTKKLIKH